MHPNALEQNTTTPTSLAAAFGLIRPTKLQFDDSGTGGFKVKYTRTVMPVAPSAPTPVAHVADAPLVAASA